MIGELIFSNGFACEWTKYFNAQWVYQQHIALLIACNIIGCSGTSFIAQHAEMCTCIDLNYRWTGGISQWKWLSLLRRTIIFDWTYETFHIGSSETIRQISHWRIADSLLWLINKRKIAAEKMRCLSGGCNGQRIQSYVDAEASVSPTLGTLYAWQENQKQETNERPTKCLQNATKINWTLISCAINKEFQIIYVGLCSYSAFIDIKVLEDQLSFDIQVARYHFMVVQLNFDRFRCAFSYTHTLMDIFHLIFLLQEYCV